MTMTLTRTAVSTAIEDSAWRLLLGAITTSVSVESTVQAIEVAQAAATACGPDADGHLGVDLRADRVEITLRTAAVADLTDVDIDLSRRIIDALIARGFTATGATTRDGGRSVQMLEIAIDAMDIAAIRPFWKAVMGYAAEAGRDRETDGVVDPARQGPSIWFQQMDEPRTQRNRIHFDISVPHDEAQVRLKAAIDAGGVLVSDAHARSFWIVADIEGNEICICTWQDRE